VSIANRFTGAAAAALVAGTLCASAAAGDSERVWVVFEEGHKGSVQRALNAQGAQFHYQFDRLNAFAVTVPAQAVRGLQNNPHVAYVEADVKRELLSTQTVPYGITMVEADQVSDSMASNMTVCVIDSGYDITHEDLPSGGNVTGTNDSGTGNWYQDGSGHGTHVAGTIVALNNDVGVVGVLPNGQLNVHIIKVFGDSGSWAYSSSLVHALNRCEDAGANVVNMSLGGSFSSTTEANAFQAAFDRGVLSVAAAGNGGNTRHSYPASYDAVVSVAAIDDQKNLASFSQRNNQVELSAPGVAVTSTVPMGTGSREDMCVGGARNYANAKDGSPDAEGQGGLVDCGLATSTCSGASGNVCLIERGQISFADKVLNCQAGGGVAAVIYNNESGALQGTLGGTSTSIPSVGISQADGQTLLNRLGENAFVATGVGNYASWNGTSMASPHVAGVAALVWSHHPACTNQEIRDVLAATAEDLGSSGRNNEFGWGLVRAREATDYISANGCAGDDNGGGDNGGGDDGDADSIDLNVTGYKVQGRHRADLSWSGAESSLIDVLRNGGLEATVSNTGAWTWTSDIRGGACHTFQVCEAGSSSCSNEVAVCP
jgi:serine protease